ncbi:fatty acyl-AMP ligase [Acetobacter sp. AN02]|uniref:fatty acyl-AMP ligase n=1 Tax=Acetobacter sp. AN02 TaxID=2894186 RepID=UPI00243436FC|nr:fatty acyl-AMP ligase [Acetobacter sp. AN02]MDG6095213.1 fatty acyl-AMP ligase [Acetobacter sp. AN02]
MIARRLGDFPTFTAALDYAAGGESGYNIYSGRGDLLEALSYARLRREARETAQRLLGLGMKPGERVGIVADSDGDFARIFFGCQYAGLVAVPMPLPVAFGGREAYIATLHGMISSAEMSAVVIPDLIGSWTGEIAEPFSLVFAGAPADLLSCPLTPCSLPEISPDALSYLQFSSGSTRFPKGICVTHRSGMANARSICRDGLQVRETGDHCVSWLPLYHDMGLVGFFLTPMACQLTVDLLPTREFARRPHVWLDLISRNKGTLSYSPSFGFELCAKRPVAEGLDLSSWRAAGIGGDMIRPHVLEEFAAHFAQAGFRAEAFVPSYGMAEATLALSFAPLNTGVRTDTIDLRRLESEGIAIPCTDITAPRRTFVLCGQALPGHEIEIHDASGRRLPERRIGTIRARGPSLMSGYYNLPEETAEALDSKGWLNTGDLGYLLDGQVVVTGRAKDLIIINGRNIWPQDLEWCAEQDIPGLRSRDVAVFSVEEGGHERVVALVQCRLTDTERREKLRESISGIFRRMHGVDAEIVLVPPHSLPQTSSGKLTRARARAMFLAGAFRSEPPAESAA